MSGNIPASQAAQIAAKMAPGSGYAQQEQRTKAAQLPETIRAEPIEAWRVWKINEPQGATLGVETLRELSAAHERGENPFARLLLPSLGSIGREHTWGTDTQAVCLAHTDSYGQMRYYVGPASPHEAPQASCSCGIWALHERSDAERTVREYAKNVATMPGFAFGRVQLWGKVVRCERGYRAQHARPLEILVLSQDEAKAADLGKRYGCEARCEIPRTLLRVFWQERKKEREEEKLRVEVMKEQLSSFQAFAEANKQLFALPSGYLSAQGVGPHIKKRRGSWFGKAW